MAEIAATSLVWKNVELERFNILRDALPRSAPQDKVMCFNDLPHPEEAPFETPPAAAPQGRRAVSKGADTGTLALRTVGTGLRR
jgi:hypothetical protein